jgi:cobalt-precorrin-7 (C5)-methyltransferase
MKIIGVGCGPGLITEEAREALMKGRVVYGSRRALKLAREYLSAECEIHEIREYRSLDALSGDAIILSTGDPMLSGLGYLDGTIIPGISSLQVAAARLHLPLEDAAIAVAHGRKHGSAMQETVAGLKKGKWIFVIADPEFSTEDLARHLKREGLCASIILCVNLGYPDEEIIQGTQEAPPATNSTLFSVVVTPEDKDLKVHP